MGRGKLVVFEGLDRAGKSTQCERLVEALQRDGMSVQSLRFPGQWLSCSRLYYSFAGVSSRVHYFGFVFGVG